MKKAVVIIFLVALIAVNVGANIGFKVIKIAPITYVQAVQEDLPEMWNYIEAFTDFYGEGETQSWTDRIFWYYENLWNTVTFPMKGIQYQIQTLWAVISNLPKLVTFDVTNIVNNGSDIQEAETL